MHNIIVRFFLFQAQSEELNPINDFGKTEKGEIKTTIHMNQRYTDREWGNNNNEHPVNNMSFGENK